MKVTKCLMAVYGDVSEEKLLELLNGCEDLKLWAYAVNDFKKHLPNVHAFLDFGKTKYTTGKIEQLFKDNGFNRCFVEVVVYREDDVIGFLSSLGHDTRCMVANFKFK